MDLEETVAALLCKNEKLGQENDQLRSMLSVFKENVDLRARLQNSNNDTLEELTVCSPSGSKPSSLMENTKEERQFGKDLQQAKVKHEQRTSSPVDFKSFIQSSVYTSTSDIHSSQAEGPLEVKDPHRLLGEIGYQLDRRILCHIFQGHKRLYGFTVLNIPEKISEVSTHPLTGKVDEGYHLYLTQRYLDLMERLSQLGYKRTFHAPFTEFIVNTYGILAERPSVNSSQTIDYNNPDFLMKLVTTTAHRRLQKDLLLLLGCLRNLAEKDRKPLLLW